MDAERWQLVRAVLEEVREIAHAERPAFLDRRCAKDAALRWEVESLLAAGERNDLPSHVGTAAATATLGSQPADSPPAIRDYRLLRRIGEGGMGEVWEAEQQRPVRRRVALKLIKFGHDSREVVARFDSERQALALMDHPNIARVFDAGATPEGRPYFVMEHIRGLRIDDHCDRHRLSIDQRLRLFTLVCDGVQHAHRKAIIHRDLKPSNILVAVHDGRAVPKIIDFGIAKAIEQRLTEKTMFTQVGALIGTPEYISPEQATLTGLDVDTRADVYSLGVVLYELLVGSPPIDRSLLGRASFDELLRMIREFEPPRPSSRLSGRGAPLHELTDRRGTNPRALVRALRGDLDWITLRALEKDPERRYDSPAALAEDIARHLAHEPVEASPPSLSYRLGRFVLRHRTATVATVIVVASLIAGTAGVAWFASAARQSGRRAEFEAEQKNFRAYQYQIQAAAASIDRDDIAGARRELASAPSELRNWEWNHLNAIADRSIATRGEHGDRVDALCYTPDGRFLASGGSDRSIGIWDAATLTLIRTLQSAGSVASMAFAPGGTLLAAGTHEGGLVVWDVAAGEAVAELSGHHSRVAGVAFDASGSTLASASWDGSVRLWDWESGRARERLEPELGHVNSVGYDADGGRLAAGTQGGSIVVWDANGRELRRLVGHSAEVYDVTFSPDGTRLASASWDETVRVWEPDSGESRVLRAHDNVVIAVAFGPHGQLVASGGRGGSVILADAAGMKPLVRLTGHSDWVHALAFDPTRGRLVSGSDDGTLKLWDVETPPAVPQLIGNGGVNAIAFSADGARIALAEDGATIRISDPRTTETLTVLEGHGAAVNGVAFHPSRHLLASASVDETVRLWDLESARGILVLEGHAGSVLDVSVDPTGTRIASGGQDATVRIWDATTGQLLELLEGHVASVHSVAFSPEGDRLASGSADGTVRLWEVGSGRLLRTDKQHRGEVLQVAFDRSGSRLASASADDTVLVRDVTSGEIVLTIRGVGECNSVDFSADGARIATGSWYHPIELWDPYGARVATLRGHKAAVWHLAFNPDGSMLASASADGTVRLWDTVPYSVRHARGQNR